MTEGKTGRQYLEDAKGILDNIHALRETIQDSEGLFSQADLDALKVAISQGLEEAKVSVMISTEMRERGDYR